VLFPRNRARLGAEPLVRAVALDDVRSMYAVSLCNNRRMADRSRDWMAQAERDLDVASRLRDSGSHEWACFAAQQAAEKAVKAVLMSRLEEPWGHSVRDLLEMLSATPGELIEKARVLDSYYIPTRYANGHATGAPFENYGTLQSEKAIDYAGEIVQFAISEMARTR
jgi:HEPN domain-containing protein